MTPSLAQQGMRQDYHLQPTAQPLSAIRKKDPLCYHPAYPLRLARPCWLS